METQRIAQSLEQSVCGVVRGQNQVVRKVLACMLSGGHILLEDYPGTGKTTMAKAIARAIGGARFKRIQFTPDLLPSDILGITVLDPPSREFRFHPGPVFTDILLADEINRASPRTQSALLEAMGERQVTIDGTRHDLDGLFFVIATQNPVEFRGTYPLPEAQMDRFAMQCALGYVSAEEEAAILADHGDSPPCDRQEAVASREDVLTLMNAVKAIRFSEELRHYAVALVSATRGHPQIQLPASPRASLSLMKVSQAMAMLHGADFVTPEVIQSVAEDVISHRIVLTSEARFSGITPRQLVAGILSSTPVPA